MQTSLALSLTLAPGGNRGAPFTYLATSGLPVCLGGRLSIPKGAAGLAHVRLTSRGHAIYPIDGSFISGDGQDFSWGGALRLEGPPWYLALEGYNADDTYTHTISAIVSCGSLDLL